MQFKAGRLVADPATKRLTADPRQGSIQVEPLDESLYSFTYAAADQPEMELVLAQGDASFHDVSSAANGQVIGLKLASSGSKFFFWLQDPALTAATVVAQLSDLLEHGPPKAKQPKFDLSQAISGFLGTHPPHHQQHKVVRPSQVLSPDNIMDAIEPDDMAALKEFLPEGYDTKSDLRLLASTPYFQQALSILGRIMNSPESSQQFLAQFALLEHAGDVPFGFAALLRALHKKYKKN